MLLDEIITLLGDQGSSLTDALLKTKILLHQIGKKDLAQWVNNELNGYSNADDLPQYRIIPSQVLANFANLARRYSSHPIPLNHLTDKQRDTVEKTRMWQSLSVLEQMASSSETGQLSRQIPMELNWHLGKQLDSSYHIESAWCVMSVHDIKGICTQVRSRLLDFMLELRDIVGDTATASELREKSTSIDAGSMFNNAIFGPGSNTTILIGHRSSITATQTISGGDLAERVRGLVEQIQPLISSLPASVREDSEHALAELREAAAAAAPDVGRLRRGLETFKRVMEHAAGHVIGAGALDLIGQLLSLAPH